MLTVVGTKEGVAGAPSLQERFEPEPQLRAQFAQVVLLLFRREALASQSGDDTRCLRAATKVPLRMTDMTG